MPTPPSNPSPWRGVLVSLIGHAAVAGVIWGATQVGRAPTPPQFTTIDLDLAPPAPEAEVMHQGATAAGNDEPAAGGAQVAQRGVQAARGEDPITGENVICVRRCCDCCAGVGAASLCAPLEPSVSPDAEALQALAIDAMLPAMGEIARDLGARGPNDRQFIIGAFLIGAGLTGCTRCDVVQTATSTHPASAYIASRVGTPEAFDAWSTGHTLDYFYSDGTLWGSEAHYSGRATTDEAEDGCREGRWFPQDLSLIHI